MEKRSNNKKVRKTVAHTSQQMSEESQLNEDKWSSKSSDHSDDDCSWNSSDTSSPPSPVVIVRKAIQSNIDANTFKPSSPPKRTFTQPTKFQRKLNYKVLSLAMITPTGWIDHLLKKAPNYARFDRKSMKWDEKRNKKKYQQYKCRSCSVNFTRTYCVCTVGEWLCKTCLPKHVLQKMTGIKSACNQTIVDICDKHTLTTAPKNAAFYSKDQQRWVIACKNEHQKHKCQLCCVRLHKNGSFYIQKVNQWGVIATTTTTDVNYCRTHCSCNPSKWMCLDCHASVHTMFICPASIVRHN